MGGTGNRSSSSSVLEVEEAPPALKKPKLKQKYRQENTIMNENDNGNGVLQPEKKKKKQKKKRKQHLLLNPSISQQTAANDASPDLKGEVLSKKTKDKRKDDPLESQGNERSKKKRKTDNGKKKIKEEKGTNSDPYPSRKPTEVDRNQNVKGEKKGKEKEKENATVNGDGDVGQPELHMDVFRELSSAEPSVREAACLSLVNELLQIQSLYERTQSHGDGDNLLQMEASKDDCLDNCAPTLRYALRRLIRGVSSSRACVRQGFALAFTTVVSAIPCIEVDALVKLIEELLEVTSSMKGQEAREGLLGRLFAYGALVRSGRLEAHMVVASDRDAGLLRDITQRILLLAEKKCFMREPAVIIILDLVDRVPRNLILSSILEAPLLKDWLQKNPENGNPDALLLTLKLFDKLPVEMRNLCKLLPHVSSPSDLFNPDHMLCLVPLLKEASFCHPRVHSVWQALLDILFVDLEKVTRDPVSSHSSEKTKKSQKRNTPEKNIAKRLASFWEVVVEGTLLPSSHDRKHLAIDIFLMLLPCIPPSFVQILLSNRFVQCLKDVLSAKDSHLYKNAQHCLEEVVNWSLNDDERRAAVVIALQVNGNGNFDNVCRTQTVRNLISKFDTLAGSLIFIQKLTGLFLEGGLHQMDKRSHPDKTSMEGKDGVSSLSVDEDDENLLERTNDSDDVLRSWIVDCIYQLSKNAALDPAAKYPLQKEILKFFAVQGLFSASLGIEVTSFELQEKLKWPKKPASIHIRRLCIEQLQHLLADAQRLLILDKHTELHESTQHEVSPFESNDLGAYAICFLRTLQSIPSVSLFWSLSRDDEHTFNKLHDAETQLFRAAWKNNHNLSKMQAMRFLLIQLLLQIPLSHGEICESANELLICCKEAFGDAIELDVESNIDESGMPVFMDVLIDVLLSLLPQSGSPIRSAVEQVFRCFCDRITESGVMNMLQVVKKDLKPPRRQSIFVGDSDEEDPIEIEESESADEAQESEDEELTDDSLEDQNRKIQNESALEEKNHKGSEDSEDLDSDFDDEAMFKMDTYLARMFKEKNNAAGSDTAQSQLVHFKLRVLSLLEFYLQRNSSKPIVLNIFSYLLQAFVNSSAAEGNEQLAERIGGILNLKICRVKEYPKDPGMDFSFLKVLLDKVLKLASRPISTKVDSLAQTFTFWLLKVINGNFDDTKVETVSEILMPSLKAFFVDKKCHLKGNFLRNVFSRCPPLGPAFFRMLIENFQTARSEFLQCEALSLMETIIKPWVGKSAQNSCQQLQFLEQHLSPLSELINQLLQKRAKKALRSHARRFCKVVIKAISLLKLDKSLTKLLQLHNPSTCESYLGDLFRKKIGSNT